MEYRKSGTPCLLDEMEINLMKPQKKSYQPENYMITNKSWKNHGSISFEKLKKYIDKPSQLWTNTNPKQDRISLEYIKNEYGELKNSLFLIKPNNVRFIVNRNKINGIYRKRVRARFNYKGGVYDLVVTDPVLENCLKEKKIGPYQLSSSEVYFTISLGLPYKGDCYKLVTGVLSNNFQDIRKSKKEDNSFTSKVKTKNKVETSDEDFDLLRLSKEYKSEKKKLDKTKGRIDSKTKKISEKIYELKEEKRRIEEPLKEKLERQKSELEKIKTKILEHHKGKNEFKKNKFAQIKFRTSKKLKVKDKEKVVDVLKEQGELDNSINIYKTPVKKLFKKGLIDEDAVDYEERRYINIKESIDLDFEDNKLYGELKNLRDEISSVENKSKYYIFGNRTLKLLAKKKPETKDEMLSIYGVGKTNSEKYGETFLEVINEYR